MFQGQRGGGASRRGRQRLNKSERNRQRKKSHSEVKGGQREDPDEGGGPRALEETSPTVAHAQTQTRRGAKDASTQTPAVHRKNQKTQTGEDAGPAPPGAPPGEVEQKEPGRDPTQGPVNPPKDLPTGASPDPQGGNGEERKSYAKAVSDGGRAEREAKAAAR